MTTSNTKLNIYEKQQLKDLKGLNPTVKLANNGQTTIAYMLKGNTVQFALSIMSPEEKKFRRKVGEYWALLRYDSGARVSMQKYDFCAMLSDVFGLYEDDNNLRAEFPE